jgi:hypothetical protein
MNWLIKKLADDNTYFPIFVSVLGTYAVVCCILMSFVLSIFPDHIGQATFLAVCGAIALAYLGRLTNRWASDKLNQTNDVK